MKLNSNEPLPELPLDPPDDSTEREPYEDDAAEDAKHWVDEYYSTNYHK